MARRGAVQDLDRVLALDEEWRAMTVRVESLRAEQNRGSREVSGASSAEERQGLIERLRGVSAELRELEPELVRVEESLRELAARLPNVPDPSVPDGETDQDNEVVRTWGEPPSFGFEPKDHVELGQALGMIDLEKGARTSGSRFAYLLGDAVRIQLALMNYGLDFAGRNGFVPVVPPVLVREEAMFGTGFLPTDAAQLYVTREDDLYLVGTSEVALASLHAGEILEPDELPRRYVGSSTCFRREAGAAGKDTRGIFRLHQFDKLELFAFVPPEASREEHERILELEEEFFRSLEIPYRVVNVCVGELGASAAKKYDIEAWFPGQGRYREITSTSNTTDYQARRLDVRVRGDDGNRHLHTLNGTLCAIGRAIIALMENGQQEDGSIVLPESLRGYLPGV